MSLNIAHLRTRFAFLGLAALITGAAACGSEDPTDVGQDDANLADRDASDLPPLAEEPAPDSETDDAPPGSTPPAMPADLGSCCEVHATPGCETTAVQVAVCGANEACCTGSWDPSCVELAIGVGAKCEDATPPGEPEHPETDPEGPDAEGCLSCMSACGLACLAGASHLCDDDLFSTGLLCAATVCAPECVGWVPPICGNGRPDVGETPFNCQVDFVGTSFPGDGICSTEEAFYGADDCVRYCGNAMCEPGENAYVCGIDCAPGCGDGVCLPYEQGACAADCKLAAFCGNGLCQPGENAYSCAYDCAGGYGAGYALCGNGVCESGEPQLCPSDCGFAASSYCGNWTCDLGEDAWTCPSDCAPPAPFCGDYVCDLGEDAWTCPSDCAY